MPHSIKGKRGRPISHPVSRMIADGELEKAREIVQSAIWQGGSVRAAARTLACSPRTLWRYCETLGLGSFYDGSQGGKRTYQRWLTEGQGMRFRKWTWSIRMFKNGNKRRKNKS